MAIIPAADTAPRDHLRDLIQTLLRQYREAGNTHKLLTFELAAAEDRGRASQHRKAQILTRFDAALAAAAADAGRQAPATGRVR